MRSEEITVRLVAVFRTFGEGDEQTTIATVTNKDGTFKMKGKVEAESLVIGANYRLSGRWTQYRDEDQFAFRSIIMEEPDDPVSIAAYMAKTAKNASLTPRVAEILTDRFGTQAIEKLLESPEECFNAVKEVMGRHCRWTLDRAVESGKLLAGQEKLRKTKVALMALLNGRGFRRTLVDDLVQTFELRAPQVVRDDPYVLMGFRGCGFKLTDKMYCDLAIEESKTQGREWLNDRLGNPIRQLMFAIHHLSEDRTGSTWLPKAALLAAIPRHVPTGKLKPQEVLDLAVSKLTISVDDTGQWIGLFAKADAERTLSVAVMDMLEPGDAWPDPESLPGLTDHQKEALRVAFTYRLGLLAGSPGCGKTYSVSAIVAQLVKRFGDQCVQVGCPTGKAAVRASVAMAERNLPIVAVTCHRLLGVQFEQGGLTFWHNRDNPLPARYVIVDEPSMLDTSLMASLLEAVSPDCHVLMTGDAEQLAPVGHGKPFFDLQRVVPTGRLTKIERNDGRVVRVCADIRDRKPFQPSPVYDESVGENMYFVECSDDEQQTAILNIMRQIRDGGTCDPVWDCQVLSSVNDGTPVARKVLNPLLQELLNPMGLRHEGLPFRVNDKIVCLANGNYWLTPEFQQWLRCNAVSQRDTGNGSILYEIKTEAGITQTLPVWQTSERATVSVANGELCKVVSIETGKMVVRFSDPPREVTVPWKYTKAEDKAGDEEETGAVGDFDLGYSLSVHKSQGSQWQYILFAIDGSKKAESVLNRNAFYTGISRCVKATFCIGKLAVARAACLRDGLAGRKTFLAETILRMKAEKNQKSEPQPVQQSGFFAAALAKVFG